MATRIKKEATKPLQETDFYAWAREQAALPDDHRAPPQAGVFLGSGPEKPLAGHDHRHGEPDVADALPAACPYTLEQIEGDWWPSP